MVEGPTQTRLGSRFQGHEIWSRVGQSQCGMVLLLPALGILQTPFLTPGVETALEQWKHWTQTSVKSHSRVF